MLFRSVDIHVLQGERPMAADNKTLGRFQLTDIPAAPRGVPQIEVKFDIDANGIVNVSAKNLGTGKEQKITIQNGGSLSEEEINRMVNEAEAHAEADKQRKEEVDVRNESDSLIFQTKKSLDELKGVTDDEKTSVNEKISALEEALKGNNIDDIKAKKDELQKVAQEVATKAYQQAQQDQQATSGQNTDNKGAKDDTVDADFTDVN